MSWLPPRNLPSADASVAWIDYVLVCVAATRGCGAVPAVKIVAFVAIFVQLPAPNSQSVS